ncbi:MAG: flagellar filament capping protein FliD [Desulforegulaceae bacterium]|nr:flagellar filament capping protein FliD [Desulforegulaceae bacterium]
MAGSISTLGIGSGLDLQNILDQLKEADRIPIRQKESKQLEYKERIEKFDVLQSKFLKTKDIALNLSLQSTYMGRESNLSDSSVLSVNTLEGAELGTYNIKVNSLAQKSSWKSESGMASGDSFVNDTGSAQTFTYEMNGKSVSLQVASGTRLSGFASMINGDSNNPGVKASVIKDGSGADSYKLLLRSETIGEEGRITILDQLSGFKLAEEAGAGGSGLDAEVEVDGVSYKRASNSISDIIQGATLNLQKSGETSFEIETDKSSIKDQILSFVESLKESLSEIKINSNYNTETNEKGSFYNLSSLRTFRSQLINDVINPINIDGSITSMVDLGIEYTRDGEIIINESTLENAIENNFEDLKNFLLGDSENDVTGWADIVNDRFRTATSAANGIVFVEKNSAQSMYDKLVAQVASDQERLDKRYDIMAKQFLELDKYMSRMSSMSSYLSQQIDSMNSAKDK